ncbi:hypothetical protein F2P56_032975, partial [Juglans regia]
MAEDFDTNMTSRNQNNPQNPASPFFIQPGEGASSSLVPHLLTAESYVTWARTKRRALNIKNKYGFIDGTITKPPNTFDPLYAPWERCNDMIIAWIQYSVSSDLRSSIAHADTTE